ncbi:MAG: MlaE family ABC transporter permease [Nannocystales bacterium]
MKTFFEFLIFARYAVAAQFAGFPDRRILAQQLYTAGVGSMALLTVLTIFAGLNLSVQSYSTFQRFGGQDFLGMFAGIGGVRELYPVMAAIICGARIGANLAAALANMKISEQVEALEVMSVDPMRHLVAPRLWAVTLALPLLCGYANVVGIAGSYYGAVHQLGLDGGTFVSQLEQFVHFSDLLVGVGKGLIFGWLVALVACFHGYRAAKKEGAEGVGIATNRAIVHGAVLCIVLNLLLSWAMYG